MVLHRHTECKKLLILFFILIHLNYFVIDSRITVIMFTDSVTKFIAPVLYTQEFIKSHSHIHLRAIPVGCIVRMHCYRFIVLWPQDICQTILRIPDIKFIWLAGCREKLNTVSCQSLIFGSRCSTSKCRYMQLTIRHILIQAVNKWQNFCIRLKVTCTFKIRKTFIHDHDNILRNSLVSCSCFLLFGSFFLIFCQDFIYFLLWITIWLFNTDVPRLK